MPLLCCKQGSESPVERISQSREELSPPTEHIGPRWGSSGGFKLFVGGELGSVYTAHVASAVPQRLPTLGGRRRKSAGTEPGWSPA